MADAKARREARMRRILANSENRLKKISGKNCEETDGTCHSSSDNDLTQTQNFNQNLNGVALGNNYTEQDAQTSQERDIGAELLPELSPENYTHQNSDTPTWVDDAFDDSNREFNYEQYSSFGREHTDSSNKTDLAKEVSNNKLINRILRNSLIYVVLAAVVNLLIFLELDHLYGKAIFIPFFTVIMARLLVPGSIEESEKGSLLVAALILCNIKPDVAYNLKRTVNLIHTVMSDFALYVFSFVTMYNGISYILGKYTDQPFTAK